MQPIDVHIHTNTQCNLRCIHCYEDSDKTIKMKISNKFELQLVEYLCGNYAADIHLEGGEVFLEEELIKTLGNLSNENLKSITITTNGLKRTHDQKTLRVLSSISCLRISVEGHTDSLHRAVRKCALQSILDNARYYKGLGVRVVLRITLNRLNMNTIFAETIPALEKLGFDEFQIYELQPVGRAKTANIYIETPLTAFYEDWLEHPSNTKIKVSLPERRINETVEYIARLHKINVVEHYVDDNASISIGVDGFVRICPWDLHSKPLIQITEKNIANLEGVIKFQHTPHECEHCTRIVLKGGYPC